MLRLRAESTIPRRPARLQSGVKVPSLEEMQALLHELEVHQIELKMQNETLRTSQIALEAARDRYADLFQFAPVGYLTLTGKGAIDNINLTGAALLGVPRNKLLQRLFSPFVIPDDKPLWYKHLADVLNTDEKLTCELALLRGDGSPVHVRLDSTRLLEDGQAPAMRVVLTDITERKQAQIALLRSEERWKYALEGAGDGLWDWNIQTGAAFYSPRYKEMFGYTDADFGTTSDEWSKRIHPDDAPGVFAGLQPYFDGKPGSAIVEFRMLCKDGRWKWTLGRGMVVSRDADGKPLRMIGTNTDIDARKQIEAELLRSNVELEQFSYAISHDMRQPLRMIASYMQLLETGLASQIDGEQREYFNFAIDGAKRMDAMMLGLLEYSRVGRKGEPPAWAESRAILDDALLFLHPEIAEVQAHVRIEGTWPRVLVSRDEMLRLMLNLIANALKFRVNGRTPEVTVTSEMVGNQWRVGVADNGVGIIPDQIGRLFQVFQRLQSRSDYEGNGIGLALCRKIVEHHGGKIWAESAGAGHGSRFCVELPLPQDEAEAAR